MLAAPSIVGQKDTGERSPLLGWWYFPSVQTESSIHRLFSIHTDGK